jgi:hypothetical protein
MTDTPVPGIFWTSLSGIVALLSVATLIGRTWCDLFPLRFRAHARFYLGPSLGLTTLTIVASLFGRVLPLGNTVFVPLLFLGFLVWSLVRERDTGKAVRHILVVSVFGVVCGVSVLSPLFVFGGINVHNDTFTYLTHSNWLQNHAFKELVSSDMVTALTSQVSLYQQGNFRMGGSFLLALSQVLLNLQWSFEAYPAVVVANISACCLAMGFVLVQHFRLISLSVRLTVLALPAFSLGGLVFGANLGFLPQVVGLTLGASLLFTVGPVFRWVVTTATGWQAIGKAAFPSAVLFVGATLAYSEIAPFLLVVIVGSVGILGFQFHAWKKILLHGGVLLALASLLLNMEMVRAYGAIRTQSNAVVGSPVDWPLLGFVAHAVGIHGGAWDLYQWTASENFWSITYVYGLTLFVLITALLFSGLRPTLRTMVSGTLLPTIAILFIFSIGIAYFRYISPSPFPKGMGQSWSQFKLSEWAHPFMMVLVLVSIANLRLSMGRLFVTGMFALFSIGFISAALIGVARVSPIMHYYMGVNDLNRFYLDFRQVVLANCPANAPVYLALGGENHKFRQIAALYLYDKEIDSDWSDDGYIYPRLPIDRRTKSLVTGSCVVERNTQNGWLSHGMQIGPFKVGIFNGEGKVRILSMTGGYARESDAENWWHWVEYKVNFKLWPLSIPNGAMQTKLYFEYGTRGAQTLTLRIIKRDGLSQVFSIYSKGEAISIFDKVIDLSPLEIDEISVETNGKASPLGDQDVRLAAMVIRNVTILSVVP